MKKLTFVLILLFSAPLFCEELKLSKLSVSWGKGAFTSGIGPSFFFENSKALVELTGNNERVYGVHFWKLSELLKLGICGGVFKNMIQSGPYVVIEPIKHKKDEPPILSLFYWGGWSLGKPEKPDLKVSEFFQSLSATFSPGSIKLSCVLERFMDEKAIIPGIAIIFKINSEFSLTTSVDYKISKTKSGEEKNEPLFCLRLSYEPAK